MTRSNWKITQETFDPGREPFYESIFSLGNGYMGVRGFKGEEAGRGNHENCTFIAGIYDELKPGITDIVNTPDFINFRISVDGEAVGFDKKHLQSYRRELDMQRGVLETNFIWRSDMGKILSLRSVRFISMRNKHFAGLRYEMNLDVGGVIDIKTGINGEICNNPISDVQLADNTDMAVLLKGIKAGMSGNGTGWLRAITSTSGIEIEEAFTVDAQIDGIPAAPLKAVHENKGIYNTGSFTIEKNQALVLNKRVIVHASRDDGWRQRSYNEETLPGYDAMLAEHEAAWRDKWEIADIMIEGDDSAQLAMRYNIFQLIQNDAEDDPHISIGARGIMHGRYKGCCFWDTEIFMFPFYLFTNPDAARNLLMYRYHTLPGAERNARDMSLKGAKYAWMSTLTGVEQCETWDTGCCEIHIVADVAYAIWQYYLATGDEEFIADYGAEMLVKTARYWVSRFTYDNVKDVYHMLFVKGPNEYGGVTHNNTYTTMMAIYNMEVAQKAIELVMGKDPVRWDKLSHEIDFSEIEIKAWENIIKKAVIAYDPVMELYIEDESSFQRLEPLELMDVKQGDVPLYRSIAFDRLQRYKVLKQADVIQLMLQLPHLFTGAQKKAAWDFYEPITAHDSSLSYGSHAAFAARLGLTDAAYKYFMKSSRLDMDDIMENTAFEGIHPASLGISWQALVGGFGGVTVTPRGLSVNPCIFKGWDSVQFKFIYRGDVFMMHMDKNRFSIRMEERSRNNEAVLRIYGNEQRLFPGKEKSFEYMDQDQNERAVVQV